MQSLACYYVVDNLFRTNALPLRGVVFDVLGYLVSQLAEEEGESSEERWHWMTETCTIF